MTSEKALARDIVSRILEHWKAFGEPYAASNGQKSYHWRIQRTLGRDWSFHRFSDFLATQKIIKVLRSRSGKQWLFLKEVWDNLSEQERAQWLEKIDFLYDPTNEVRDLKAQGKMISARGKRKDID